VFRKEIPLKIDIGASPFYASGRIRNFSPLLPGSRTRIDVGPDGSSELSKNNFKNMVDDAFKFASSYMWPVDKQVATGTHLLMRRRSLLKR
jgi:hypothetical protein